jgi:hypothetical protein
MDKIWGLRDHELQMMPLVHSPFLRDFTIGHIALGWQSATSVYNLLNRVAFLTLSCNLRKETDHKHELHGRLQTTRT